MKKLISIALSVLCVAALFTGCAKQVSGQVATDGSTSMEKVIGALGESFMSANSGTTFTYNPTGSGSGIKAVSGRPLRHRSVEPRAEGRGKVIRPRRRRPSHSTASPSSSTPRTPFPT